MHWNFRKLAIAETNQNPAHVNFFRDDNEASEVLMKTAVKEPASVDRFCRRMKCRLCISFRWSAAFYLE
jgi:hypothetical protein